MTHPVPVKSNPFRPFRAKCTVSLKTIWTKYSKNKIGSHHVPISESIRVFKVQCWKMLENERIIFEMQRKYENKRKNQPNNKTEDTKSIFFSPKMFSFLYNESDNISAILSRSTYTNICARSEKCDGMGKLLHEKLFKLQGTLLWSWCCSLSLYASSIFLVSHHMKIF